MPEASNKGADVAESRSTGLAMWYRDLGAGDADPLLLLHAFPINGKMFEPQMGALSATRRVIAPDFPGFGRSPRTPAQPDVRDHAGCVRALPGRGAGTWGGAGRSGAAPAPGPAPAAGGGRAPRPSRTSATTRAASGRSWTGWRYRGSCSAASRGAGPGPSGARGAFPGRAQRRYART